MIMSKMVAFKPHLCGKAISIIYCYTGCLIIEAGNCSIFGQSSYSIEHRLRYHVHHADNPHRILCFMWFRGVIRGVKVPACLLRVVRTSHVIREETGLPEFLTKGVWGLPLLPPPGPYHYLVSSSSNKDRYLTLSQRQNSRQTGKD